MVISLGTIKVYKSDKDKPEEGEKLNKPALVTLFNQRPDQGDSVENYETKLEKYVACAGF